MDHFEGLMATIQILSDQELMRAPSFQQTG